MNFEIELNKKDFARLQEGLNSGRIRKQVERIILYHTGDLHERSQRRVPVRTGHLKRSATVGVSLPKLEGRVKYTAEYAGYLEKGTRYMAARPYLKPSLNEVEPKFIDDMKRIGKLTGG